MVSDSHHEGGTAFHPPQTFQLVDGVSVRNFQFSLNFQFDFAHIFKLFAASKIFASILDKILLASQGNSCQHPRENFASILRKILLSEHIFIFGFYPYLSIPLGECTTLILVTYFIQFDVAPWKRSHPTRHERSQYSLKSPLSYKTYLFCRGIPLRKKRETFCHYFTLSDAVFAPLP